MAHTAYEQAVNIIKSEANGLNQLASSLNPQDVEACVQQVLSIKGRIIVTGVGKSGLIASKIAATLSSTGTPASFMHLADAGHGDLGMITDQDLLMVLSNSGRSRELLPVLTYCRKQSIPMIAVTANGSSALAKAADNCLLIPAVDEACPLGLAPMSSTTMQLALGDALAGALIHAKGFTRQEFGVRHMSGSLGLRTMTVGEFLQSQDNEFGAPQTPIVPPDAIMTEVVSVITSGRMGATLVREQESGRVAEQPGLITDGDIRRALEKPSDHLLARDIMTAHPHILPDTALLTDALAQMHQNAISVIVIEETSSQAFRLVHLHDLMKLGL